MYCTDVFNQIVSCASPDAVYRYGAAAQTNQWEALYSNPLVIGVWLGSAALCAFLAKSKNRNPGKAVIVGLLFSVIGVIIYALMSHGTYAEDTARKPEGGTV